MAIKLTIDHDTCSGHGRCYSLLPNLFIDDERGIGQVVGHGILSDDHAELADRAVELCPERAISTGAE